MTDPPFLSSPGVPLDSSAAGTPAVRWPATPVDLQVVPTNLEGAAAEQKIVLQDH